MASALEKRRCGRTTRAGQQCKKVALPGSLFCWLHYPRGSGLVINVIVGAGFFFLGIIYTEWQVSRDRIDAFSLANVSRARELPRISGFPASIIRGTMTVVQDGPGPVMNLIDELPFRIVLAPDGTVRVDGEIRDENNVVVAQLNGLHLLVEPGVGYDTNSDRSALEVVDAARRPVLQIVSRPGCNCIAIYYRAFRFEADGSLAGIEVCDQEGWSFTDAGGQDQYLALKRRGEALKPLFRYPGLQYPGSPQ